MTWERAEPGHALAETLRLNTTVTLLDLSDNALGEGAGRSLAETLRLNTALAKLDLSDNDMGKEVRSALREERKYGQHFVRPGAREKHI